jgi:hypothetical protein
VLRGPALVIERASGAYRELIGDRDPVGKPLLELIPEVADSPWVATFHRVMTLHHDVTGMVKPSQLRPGDVGVMNCWSFAPLGLPDHVGVELTYVAAADFGSPQPRLRALPASRRAA